MPLIKYLGGFVEGLELPGFGHVARNHQVEVDREMFESLICQEGWVAVEKKKPADKPASKKPDAPTGEHGPEVVTFDDDTNVIPAVPDEPIEGDKS